MIDLSTSDYFLLFGPLTVVILIILYSLLFEDKSHKKAEDDLTRSFQDELYRRGQVTRIARGEAVAPQEEPSAGKVPESWVGD